MGMFNSLGQDSYDRQYTDGYLLKRIASYFQNQRSRLLMVGGTLLFLSLTGALTPVLVSSVVDALENKHDMNLVIVLIGAFLVTAILQYGANMTRRWLLTRIIGDGISQMRKDAFAASVRRDLAFYAEQLFLAGLSTVDAKQFELAEPTLAGAQSTQSWALQEQDKLRAYLDPFDTLVARRIGLGVLVLERIGRDDEARTLALAVTALAEAVPFALDGRRFLMALAYLDEATPVLGTSPHLRERTAGLSASLDGCRSRAFDIFSKAPAPVGELNERWQRLLSNAQQLSPAEFMQQLAQLYWVCLSRLVRLVVDAEASSGADASSSHAAIL